MAMNNPNPKFNTSFEALYAISMSMADNCIGNKQLEQRFSKLDEEYRELIKEFAGFINDMQPTRVVEGKEFYNGEDYKERIGLIKGELADVLFVLLHIAHKMDFTAFELLHSASSKMLKRMNDPNYTAKN